MKLTTFALAALAATAPATSGRPHGSGAEFGWLSGDWCLRTDEGLVEESWLPARGGLMLGMSRTTRGGRTAEFEFLRIERAADATNYLAQPGGRPPTPFRLTASGPGWARFENRGHDFPQRVEYRRTARGLSAEIAGPGRDGGEKAIPFDYLPCGEEGE